VDGVPFEAALTYAAKVIPWEDGVSSAWRMISILGSVGVEEAWRRIAWDGFRMDEKGLYTLRW
jgi:hypothetical protein